MKKMWGFAAIAAIALTAGCSSSTQAPSASTTASVAADVQTSVATVQCLDFCERTARIVNEKCDTDGAECADMLTSKALLAMKIRKADSATPEVKTAASSVADSGSEFGTERCGDEVHMSSTCADIASTVESSFTELDRLLHTA